MRKLYILLSLLVSLSFVASAQQCLTDSGTAISVAITPSIDSLAFFTPSSDSLPCIPTGWGPFVYDTLYFTTFSTLNGFHVDSLTIDSINNLPPGLCWASTSGDNTFGAGQNGAIQIGGRIAAYPGQYKLQVYVTVTTDILTLNTISLERAIGLRYYMRVTCPGQPCPPLDTTGGKDSLYIPYSALTCDAGINEVSAQLNNISVVPNPFSSSAEVSFFSTAQGIFSLRLMNMLGEVVSAKDISVVHGSNQVPLERGYLSSGIYLLSVSDGSSPVIKKVAIE